VSDYSPELQTFLNLLDKKEKMVAMMAPSFPVDFSSPEVVGKLRRLGFSHVVEVAVGAAETNKGLLELLRANPASRFITSPCPSIVRLIRAKYPQLIKYLAPVDSPMAMTSKLVKEKYPDHRLVFIGPCVMKKLEASEDHPELKIVVLTYKEIKEVFRIKKIKNDKKDFSASFDLIGPSTRLYSISGGLTQSASLNSYLTDEELDVVSGIENVQKALEAFPTNRLKVLDILNCWGGCISGPGITSKLSLEQRRARVITHWAHGLR